MSKGESCAYCGEPAEDREHVVPQCLLINRDRPLVLPSCRACNVKKSKEDVYLRDFFAIREETSGLPHTQGMTDAMLRSIERKDKDGNPRTGPARAIFSTGKREYVISPSGDIVQTVTTVTADAARVVSGLQWIVRGLHYRHTGIVVPETDDCVWWSYNGPENKERFDVDWANEHFQGPFEIGDTMIYKGSVVADVPTYSNWLLTFYERVFIPFTINEGLLRAEGRRRGLMVDHLL